jgi:hypothetical protein
MKIEKLFGGIDDKFRANDINTGDVICYRNQYYLMDPENFNFDQIAEQETRISKQKIQKFLDDKNIDISANDFMILWNLQVWLKTKYPDHMKYAKLRGSALFEMLQNGPEKPMPLSDAFKRKIVMCTEMSALAQMYLQHRGITSVLYSGNAFTNPNKDIQFGGDGHAWLMVTLNGKKYFYDPVNPIIDNNMLLPAIMDYSKLTQSDIHDFEEIIHKSPDIGGGFAYLEAVDIYGTGRRWLYGFEGGNRRRVESAVKRQFPKTPPVPSTHTRN